MKIVDISTPQAKIRVVRRLLLKLRLRLLWAYIRRDSAKIGLKYLEWKGRKYETANTDKDSIGDVSNTITFGREVDNGNRGDGGRLP